MPVRRLDYLHTGIEKQFEVKKYQQGIPLTDRVDYLSNLNNNLCYALAVSASCRLKFRPWRSGCA